MKKLFFPCFTGFCLACIITSITYSQNSTKSTNPDLQAFTENDIFKSTSEMDPGNPLLNELKRNEINATAMRNFIKNYNAPGAKWFRLSNGLFASFIDRENIKTWINYNKKGVFEYMMRFYNEQKLPAGIRHLVKSNFYDFSIYHVTEITRNDKTAYIVKLEDKDLWKTIKVIDGEMEVIEVYSKL